ncbi:MAG: O-methyltransferase [Firmicutes bacterium]|nr:O-methyltransferase [Bacillota bacterium]MCL1954126.1 O-methyltransferase [Bacillota bacterium]
MDNNTTQFLKKLIPNNDEELIRVKQLGIQYGVPIISDMGLQFLKTFVASLSPHNILEIGTGVGYSGLAMLKFSKKAKLISIELQQELASVARTVLSSYDVQVLQGDCRQLIPDIACGKISVDSSKFDLIFMDGPKSAYNQLLPYFVKLLKCNGVLLCDNVLFRGHVADIDNSKPSTIVRNMRDFLHKVNQPPFVTSIVDVGDGMSISVIV